MRLEIALIALRAALATTCLGLIACSSSIPGAPPAAPLPTVGPPLGQYVKHVVFIVQENRSFDNVFAGWPGADAPMTGYGTRIVHKKWQRFAIPLRSMRFEQQSLAGDICHTWDAAITAWNKGRMDGFNRQPSTASCVLPTVGKTPYVYIDRTEIGPYRQLAAQYTLADHMFPTEFGTSFTAHQDMIAGTTRIDATHSLVDVPIPPTIWGCDAAAGTTTSLVDTQRQVTANGPFPCLYQYATVADTLDTAKRSWRYYAQPAVCGIACGGIWSAFDAIKAVRYTPSRWAHVISPDTKALKDLAQGDLADVTWITPDVKWADYPAYPSDWGPSWVGDLVNAIGESKNWRSTAIVVLWDDWGGLYDNVPPPQLDYLGLAIRVPCIVISPYAKKNYVSHTQYEYGSLLKFVEEAFDLPSLKTTDVRANSIVDSFDFTQTPRAFVPIATKYPPSFFVGQPPSNEPPDPD